MKIKRDKKGLYVSRTYPQRNFQTGNCGRKEIRIRPIVPVGYQHVFKDGTVFNEGDEVYATHRVSTTRYVLRDHQRVKDSTIIEENWFIDNEDS